VDPKTHGIGAGFHDTDDPGATNGRAQRIQGRPDGRWVVREIVIDGNLINHADYLEAAFYAAERGECGDRVVQWDTDIRRGARRGICG